jgi:hypothetical protein
MDTTLRLSISALVTGSVASIVSTVALAVLARSEGSGVQPTNATSHWLRGDEAARRENADIAHTSVGYATHHAVFWALPFEAWLAKNPAFSSGEVLAKAAATSALASPR